MVMGIGPVEPTYLNLRIGAPLFQGTFGSRQIREQTGQHPFRGGAWSCVARQSCNNVSEELVVMYRTPPWTVLSMCCAVGVLDAVILYRALYLHT